MRLLDLFCGAGGAAMGYHRAGFGEVVGVDIAPQPDYPFDFVQEDALDYLRTLGEYPSSLSLFDAIHASPPCQAFSGMKVMPNAREHPDLLAPTRESLRDTGLPWVIENVEGAPMEAHPPTLFGGESGGVLCGSMFGLWNDEYQLRRHRLFETNVVMAWPQCAHRRDVPVVGFYGDHARVRQRVNGHKDRGRDILGTEKMRLVSDVMGIDWMSWEAANQAIPPAYTEYIGEQLLEHLYEREAVAA